MDHSILMFALRCCSCAQMLLQLPSLCPAGSKPFDAMNGIAASMLLNMTSSVRFEGSLNVDLNDITMNLVPFPRVSAAFAVG
jgi:hypothetical protein